MARHCMCCQQDAENAATVAGRKADIEQAVIDASGFLRAQGLMPDDIGTNQIVRTVLYGLAVENWRLSKLRA